MFVSRYGALLISVSAILFSIAWLSGLACAAETPDTRPASSQTVTVSAVFPNWGGASVDELISFTTHSDLSVRGIAALHLGMRADKKAIEPVARLLQDDEELTRILAADALGRLGDKRGVPVPLEALKSISKLNALSAAEALARMGNKSGMSVINANLADSNWLLRRTALMAFALLPGGASAQAIAAGMADESHYVRQTAFSIAETQPSPEIRDLLIRYTLDSDPVTRRLAVVALSKSDPVRNIPVLISRLTDPDSFVRMSTLYCLGRLSGREVIAMSVSSIDSARYIQRQWGIWWMENYNKPLPPRPAP